MLNRLMFLYFVQRKRWLGNDLEFLDAFWMAYKAQRSSNDQFYNDWLQVLFFEAFNNRFQAGRSDRQHFPPSIRNALVTAPYLNGGLFERNELDRKHTVQIADQQFANMFAFFNRYNFTISEDTPLDQEVAVDPEMIGKVYESLVNVSEDVDERGEAGIFYTPRTEIDLMCRLALVDWLGNHLGADTKPLLYELAFAFDDAEKEGADREARERNMWPELHRLLSGVQVVDPACGSGSFLVGMLLVLDNLLRRADNELGKHQSPYERRREIIANSLYGVDVKGWAIHVAELRLWLQLVIETDLAREELTLQPLLPNLSFKLRIGDSLVQEVGGVNLGLRREHTLIPTPLKGRLTHLKGEKLKFYRNDPNRRYRTAHELEQAELSLFRDILAERVKTLQDQIAQKRALAEQQRYQTASLPTMEQARDATNQAERARTLSEVAALENDLKRVHAGLEALRRAQDVPFVWDIAFVEVFEGENAGFDIVIGNPPYVRHEKIAPPNECEAGTPPDARQSAKKAYKEKLARSVYAAFPRTFGYRWQEDKPTWKLDAKSDLYIYFYFLGLSLLNRQGSFCFITSNSWLDVGYGKDLQQFLLTRGQVKLVLDNRLRRSFSGADVNTVIALLGPPHDAPAGRSESLQYTARFVMAQVPFETLLSPVIWEEVEEAAERQQTLEYRVFPIPQAALLAEGSAPEEARSAKAARKAPSARYQGNKWGGKYLRAPDIYWTILEKGKGKLVRLGDIAEVRRGITTGANEFFFLDQERIALWGIESDFLVPALKNVREVDRIVVDAAHFRLRLFMCARNRAALGGTAALKYIKWGESQGFHKRPSCRGRNHWWSLGHLEPATINCNYQIGYVQHFLVSSHPFFVSDNFQSVHCHDAPFSLAAVLNSSWTQLNVSMIGRTNFGGGLLKIQTYEMADIITVNPGTIDESTARDILGKAGILALGDNDRRALDDLIFDILGLTQGKRDAVYEELIRLVEARLEKAQSV